MRDSLAKDASEEVDFLSLDPLPGTNDTIDGVVLECLQQLRPLCVLSQVFCLSDDDQSVLGPRNRHIYAIVLLNEVARLGSDHRDEDDVKFSAL